MPMVLMMELQGEEVEAKALQGKKQGEHRPEKLGRTLRLTGRLLLCVFSCHERLSEVGANSREKTEAEF